LLRDHLDLLFQNGVVLFQSFHHLQDLMHPFFQYGHLIYWHSDDVHRKGWDGPKDGDAVRERREESTASP